MEEMTINFSLSPIQILSKSMAQLSFEEMKDFEFQFEITIEQKVQAKTKSVLFFVFVNVFNKDKTQLRGSLNTVIFFFIQNFDELIKVNEQNIYTVPSELELLLRPIAISTVRGIVYSEFRGTHLHNAIMPVIFMKDMHPVELKEDQKKILDNIEN